jgi:hypothetical protein
MKINYKNTALGFLEPGADIDFIVPDRDKGWTLYEQENFRRSVIESFKENPKLAVAFKEHIQFISHPFINAYEKARTKLKDLFYQESLTKSGTLIWISAAPNGKQCTNTMFYAIETKGQPKEQKENWDFNCFVMLFQKSYQSEKQILAILHLDHVPDEEERMVKMFLASQLAEVGMTPAAWIGWLVSFLLFCKHCEIETKMVEPSKKVWHAGEKYLNETRDPVEILDSTWFTTIVRSEEFTVGESTGGFFRWQPAGVGKQQRKLIWIMPFKKQGYTRRAKVELEREKQP